MSTPGWLARHMKPCVIYRREVVGTDEYNNPVYGEDIPVAASCFLQPLNQAEILDGRAEVATFLVHFPSSVVGELDGFARLEVDGQSYEAAGPPATFPSFFTSDHHVEMVVQRGSA